MILFPLFESDSGGGWRGVQGIKLQMAVDGRLAECPLVGVARRRWGSIGDIVITILVAYNE